MIKLGQNNIEILNNKVNSLTVSLESLGREMDIINVEIEKIKKSIALFERSAVALKSKGDNRSVVEVAMRISRLETKIEEKNKALEEKRNKYEETENQIKLIKEQINRIQLREEQEKKQKEEEARRREEGEQAGREISSRKVEIDAPLEADPIIEDFSEKKEGENDKELKDLNLEKNRLITLFDILKKQYQICSGDEIFEDVDDVAEIEGSELNCDEIINRYRDTQKKLEQIEERVKILNRTIVYEESLARSKGHQIKDSLLNDLRTRLGNMFEDLSELNTAEKRQDYIKLSAERISIHYKILKALFDDKKKYYETLKVDLEKDNGAEVIIDELQYRTVRYDVNFLKMHLEQIAPQQRTLDQLITWQRELIGIEKPKISKEEALSLLEVEYPKYSASISQQYYSLSEVKISYDDFAIKTLRKVHPEIYKAIIEKLKSKTPEVKDETHDLLINYLSSYEFLGREMSALIRSLITREKKIAKSIKENNPELWKEVKEKSSNPEIKNVVMVYSPIDFVSRFDKRINKSPDKRFYFTDEFMANPNNVFGVIGYLRDYYLGNPIIDFEKMLNISRGKAAELLGVNKDKWIDISLSLKHKRRMADGKIENIKIEDIPQSLIDKISKKTGCEKDLLEEELVKILQRIFAYNTDIASRIDPEDRNYYIDKDGQKRRLIFRGIDSSLHNYIHTSLTYFAIKSANNNAITKAINCPFSDCNGRVHVNIKDFGDASSSRTSFSKWRKILKNKEGIVTNGMSRCDTCDRPFSNVFVNCPKCMHAVPLSSTLDVWKKYSFAHWRNRSILNVGGNRESKITFINDVIGDVADVVSNSVSKHKRYGGKKVREFKDALEIYIKSLKASEKGEWTEHQIDLTKKILTLISFSGLSDSDKALDVVTFINKNPDTVPIRRDFNDIWTRFMSKQLLSYKKAQLFFDFKRGIIKRCDVIKLLKNSQDVPGLVEPERHKAVFPGLKYMNIKSNANRFVADLNLVCPNCKYGLIEGDGLDGAEDDKIFNPSKLNKSSISVIVKGEVSANYDLNITEEGGAVFIGNTSDCDISYGLDPASVEVPAYKIKVQQNSPSSFAITNLSSGDIKTSSGFIYEGQTKNIITGNCIIIDKIMYRLNSGIFLVSPIMTNADSNILYSSPTEELSEEKAKERADLIFGASIADSYQDKEDRKAIQDLLDYAMLIIKSFYMMMYPNEDIDDVGQYLLSLGLDSPETNKVAELLAKSTSHLKDPKKIKLSDFFNIFAKNLVIEMEAVAPGTENYDEWVKDYVETMKEIMTKVSSLKWAEEKAKKYLTDYTNEEEIKSSIKIQKDNMFKDLYSKIKTRIVAPRGAIRQKRSFREFVDRTLQIYEKLYSEENVDLRHNIYQYFSPMDEEGDDDNNHIKASNFFAKHLMQDNIRLITLESLAKILTDLPDSLVDQNSIYYEPEKLKGKYSKNYLPQIIKSIQDAFLIQYEGETLEEAEKMESAANIEKKELDSFGQIMAHVATIFIQDQAKSNPKLFECDVLDVKNKMRGVIRESRAYDAPEFSRTIITQEDYIISKIDKIYKDGKIIADHSKDKNAIRIINNQIYISGNIKVGIGDEVIINGEFNDTKTINKIYPLKKGNVVVQKSNKKGYFALDIGNNDFVTHINMIFKDGAPIDISRAKMIRGRIYIPNDIGLVVGDIIGIDVLAIRKSFYYNNVYGLLGKILGDMFGSGFEYNIHAKGKIDKYYLNPIISRTGLDKFLHEFYNTKIVSGEDANKKMAMKAKLRLMMKAYNIVIATLEDISEEKKDVWGISGKDYIHAIERVPIEKQDEFWKTMSQYIVGYPNNTIVELRYDSRTGKRIINMKKITLSLSLPIKPVEIKTYIETLFKDA